MSVETGEIYEIIFQPKGKCRKFISGLFKYLTTEENEKNKSIYSYVFSEHIGVGCVLLEAYSSYLLPFPFLVLPEQNQSVHSPCFCRIPQNLDLKCHSALELSVYESASPPPPKKEDC